MDVSPSFFAAARIRAWPARSTPSLSTSTGIVHHHLLTDAAILSRSAEL
jgi:hypothetical protein